MSNPQDGGIAAAGDLVQRAERQPAARARARAERHALKALNLLAKP
jgi:hypothetical protein